MSIKIREEDKNILERLEHDLWRESTRFDSAYMDKIMAEDFFEFGRSGRIHSRESCISQESVQINAVIPLQNLTIRMITEDVAQVTYNSSANYDGVEEKGRRSSIWSKTNGQWELRFHQGTPYDY